MRFDLGNKEEKVEAEKYLEKLSHQKSIVDIKKKFHRRTLSQNNYLHLLLSYCAIEVGETLDYFKQFVWKQIINKDIFQTKYTNPKTGSKRDDWKSSADLDTKQMTLAVDRLLDWSSKELGIELPLPSNIDGLRSLENYVENNRRYL